MVSNNHIAWRIASDGFEAEIVPALGRIMHFGPIGGANAFWTDPAGTDVGGWRNFGGEKLWLWPQDRWTELGGPVWPPPIDGRPWRGVAGDDWAEWELPLAPELPGFIRRRTTINGPLLRVISWIDCPASDGPFRPWSVTQIERPACLRVISPSGRVNPDPGQTFERFAEGWEMNASPPGGGKWFFDANRIVTETPAGGLAIGSHANPPPGPDEPIERSQVFFDADVSNLRPYALPPYVEIEFVAMPGSAALEVSFELMGTVIAEPPQPMQSR